MACQSYIRPTTPNFRIGDQVIIPHTSIVHTITGFTTKITKAGKFKWFARTILKDKHSDEFFNYPVNFIERAAPHLTLIKGGVS